MDNINDKENNKRNNKEKRKENQVLKEKKTISMKKFIVNRVCFFCIFTFIVVGITLYFATKNKSIKTNINNQILTHNIITSKKEEKEEHSVEKIANLNGTYTVNSIIIKDKKFDEYGDELFYPQIEGLKDKNVENKINHKIREKFKENIEILLSQYDGIIHAYYDIEGNFSNILSMYCDVYVDVGNDMQAIEFCLNYNLIDGNEITIDDVFSSKFPIETVLIDELYENIVQTFTETTDIDWELKVSDDAEDIEEIIYSIISDYQRGKIKEFYVTPQHVVILCENYWRPRIFLYEYAEYVTIYDKYVTSDNIYEEKYLRNIEFDTFTNLEGFSMKMEEYFKEETSKYYMNISLFVTDYKYEPEIPENVKNTAKACMEEFIKQKKNEEIEDGIYRLYNTQMLVRNSYADENIYHLEISDYSYDTTKSKYINTLKNEIKEYFREGNSDYPEWIGNLFIDRINYYEPIEKENGEYDYIYHEILIEDNIKRSYYDIEIDEVGNIISGFDGSTILENID